ncbi:MAG: hypothetical protein NC238_16065 [Dehalobacter sp.]|nr:hypothetical protein [Dehalobacter sp.]
MHCGGVCVEVKVAEGLIVGVIVGVGKIVGANVTIGAGSGCSTCADGVTVGEGVADISMVPI